MTDEPGDDTQDIHAGCPPPWPAEKMSSDVTAISGMPRGRRPETMLTARAAITLACGTQCTQAPVQRDQYPPRTLPFRA